MRPLRFSGLVFLSILLLALALAFLAGYTSILVVVEPALADSSEDDTNHPPNITVQTKNNLGLFDNVPDTITTPTYVNTEWRAILEDPDGDAVSVHWNFSDGFTNTSVYVNHSYKDPGEYLLEVEAFDGNETNGRVKSTILVIVEPNVEPVGVINITAPAIEWVTPPKDSPLYRGLEARINKGDSIVFDASDSYDPDGQLIASYRWEFDDVYATEENPNVATLPRTGHKFKVEGLYNVTLTLFDGVKYGYLNVWIHTNNVPIVVMPGGLRSETNKEITFDGSRSSDPDQEDKLQFKWDFGDNTRTEWSASPFSTHSYRITATYTITLWVTDGLMTAAATTTLVIDPENHPPVAVTSIQEDDLWTNMSLHFSSIGSYDIDGEGRISFTWDFDDGTDPSTLANPIHMYEDPGTYNVRLTVIDAKNVIDTDDLVLTVQRNYGDTDIIIKAVDSNTQKTFHDPAHGDPQRVAVMRGGWVAYLCDLRADQEMIVNITIIGDRPADVYLFKEVHFQTYKRNPQVTFVPFEADGFKHNATDVFDYSFTASEADRYYIVIDNKNRPLGTDTEGPVDYYISIDLANPTPVANGEILEDLDDLWTDMPIHFSSNGSYDIEGEGRISFTWDFDDGSDPSTLANPIHVYEDPGTYTVTLTVIDQSTVTAQDTLTLTVQHNYGDTDIIMRAVSPDMDRTFYDPPRDQLVQVAVMRDGWVAYLCDLRAGQVITVRITIIGNRPADVYLFKEVDFQTYKHNPQATFVPFEAKGFDQNVLGEFRYDFTAQDTGRYYIVIDNKDWPTGTETEGPVDYTISIRPVWETGPPPEDPDDLWIIMTAFAILAVLAVVNILVFLYGHRKR